MAVNGVNGCNKALGMSWKVGLINYANKYLTAESFGCKINVSGTGLKKKQTFSLVQDPVEEVVYIRSHLGRFMSADKYGNVTCEAEEPEQTEKFVVEYDPKGSGRWAFKNLVHSTYLGGTEDSLKCIAMSFTHEELWTVQLSIHPQVHLRNVNRKRYAHVCDDQLQITQTIPWADKSLLFLDFIGGKYALRTFDNRYLQTSGELAPHLTEDAKFTLEIRSGQNGTGLAFKDCNGCYLTGVGATATMKGRNKTVSKDELFTLEDTHPQVVLFANNGKKVSIKQGVDVSANQEEEESDREIFQMEFDADTHKWAFRTIDNKLWSLEPLGGIQAVGTSLRPETLFDVEWQEDGSIGIKGANGNYVYNKPTGSLVAGSDSVTDKERFRVKVANRPMLVLRTDFGFVGSKCPGSAKEIVCNRSNYEVIFVEHGEPGVYYLKTPSGQYWSVSDDKSIVTDGSGKSPFRLQCRDNRTLTIQSVENNCFIKGEQNGLFRAVGSDLEKGVLWEY